MFNTELFTKLVKKYVYPTYEDRDLDDYNAKLPFAGWIDDYIENEGGPDNYCFTALPHCCAVYEISDSLGKVERDRVLAWAVSDKFVKKVIHITTKGEKGYAKYLTYGFKVVDKFMGNHGKTLTQLELKVPDERPWLLG